MGKPIELYRHCMRVCAEQKIWNGYRYPKFFQGVQLISWHKHWSWTGSDRETLVRKEHWFKTVLVLWHVWIYLDVKWMASHHAHCFNFDLDHSPIYNLWTWVNYDKLFDQNLRGIQVTQNHHSVEVGSLRQKSQRDSGWIPTAMASLLRPQVVSSCCSANVQGSRSI